MGETGTRARQATRSVFAASQTAARAAATVGRGAASFVHRLTGASGASRTGLASLIELTAAGSVGDGFVGVALAGTLFFSASVDQARGKLAIALLVTMAPFAVLAPLIGPALDRVQHGRRYILSGTLLARGLLCWGMAGAVQHNDTLTLLPAAFGVLVLQKAYGVTRSAVAPRLLPAEITLTSANARSGLASLIATTLGAAAAAGVVFVTGGGQGGAAWALRFAMIVYLGATVLGLRLPEGVDAPPGVPARRAGAGHAGAGATDGWTATGPHGTRPLQHQPAPPWAATAAGTATAAQAAPPGGSGHGRPAEQIRWRTLTRVGPVVGEAIAANATSRAYSGFMIFFLAFLLRTVHFGKVPDKVAFGEMVAAALIGGFIGTGLGALVRSRAPQVIIFGMLAVATLITATCAVFYGLWAALVVALVAGVSQSLVKIAQDAIVQREIGEEIRSSTFAASETVNQLSWVIGALAGLLLSMTDSGVAGLTVATVGLACSLTTLLLRRRRRILGTRAVLAAHTR